MFELHPQLKQDCIPIGRFSLCQILLMNDSHYPWFLLVPERDAVSEVYQLSDPEQAQLWRESAQLSRQLAATFNADKMNIAALGNIVPQLHVHHIVRYRSDPAWPAPVWGKLPARAYTEAELQSLLTRLLPVFNEQMQLA
jgi:diadenosine tetraphosphate (Ap4A) HIT family hydrolase